MKLLFNLTLLTLACTSLQAQNNAETEAIVTEGKALYRSEMASWFGTDIFLQKFKDQRANLGGYFSYADGNNTNCVFFTKDGEPKVIAVITFDSTYNVETATVNDSRRDFLPIEQNLYSIRKNAYAAIRGDTMFKSYQNTRLNLVPIISGNDKKVYVLTGPSISGVVVFGNDYLLTFDANNILISKKQLHRNIIPINHSDGAKEEYAMHSHLPETGEYITATDICTLMLYGKLAKWKQHIVMSEKYVNIWDCDKNQLVVLTRKAWDRINKDQKERRGN